MATLDFNPRTKPQSMEMQARKFQAQELEKSFLFDVCRGRLKDVEIFLSREAGRERRAISSILDTYGDISGAVLNEVKKTVLPSIPEKENALHLSCRFGHHDVIRCLSSHSQELRSGLNSERETPLFVALKTSHLTLEIFPLLLGSGSSLMRRDNQGQAPLHWIAEKKECFPFLQFVLDWIDNKDKTKTALMDYLPAGPLADIVVSYLDFIVPNILKFETQKGETPLDIAKTAQTQDPEMKRTVDLLTEAMEKFGFIETPKQKASEPQIADPKASGASQKTSYTVGKQNEHDSQT